MVDLTTTELQVTPPKKMHPAVEEFKSTAKLFLSNKLALVGGTITAIYFLIALLDVVYPEYLGGGINGSNTFTIISLMPYGSISPATPGSSLVYPSLFPVSHYGFPAWWFFLGTTMYQVPILPAMLIALKYDLSYSLFVVLIGGSLGIVVGVVAGYLGGIFDELLMRITDIFFSIPFIVLLIAWLFVVGNTSLLAVSEALVIIWWPIYARLVRGQALSTKALNYVEAARAAGSSKFRNIFVHVLPNVLSPVYVQFSLDLGTIVLIFATLDFLSIVHLSYLPELGALILGYGDGLGYLVSGYWWPAIIPGIFLLIFTVSINLMGDGLRDVLDPKLRK